MRTFLFVLIVSFFSFNSYSQVRSLSASPKNIEDVKKERPENYVILTKDVNDLPLILMTIKELNEKSHGQTEVILYGSRLIDLKDSSEIKEYIKMAEELKVTIFVCAHSLKMNDLNPEDFQEFMKPIDNGIKHSIDLQKRGYTSLTL